MLNNYFFARDLESNLTASKVTVCLKGRPDDLQKIKTMRFGSAIAMIVTMAFVHAKTEGKAKHEEPVKKDVKIAEHVQKDVRIGKEKVQKMGDKTHKANIKKDEIKTPEVKKSEITKTPEVKKEEAKPK